jgi:hypothetical protein
MEDTELLPLTFAPDARFFFDEEGDPVSVEDGKMFALGPKGTVLLESPPLTGEERWTREVSEAEVLKLIDAKRSS